MIPSLLAAWLALPALALAQVPAPSYTPAAVSHFPDDKSLTLGATRTTADCSLGWETAGTEHYLSLVCPTLSGLLLGQDANVDRDAVLGGSLRLGVCSEDGGSASECLSMDHDGTDGFLRLGSGRLKLQAQSGGIVDVLDTDGDFTWSFGGAVNNDAQLWASANGLIGFVLTVDAAFNQTTFAPRDAAGGRQLLITDYANRAKDHSIAAPTDPGLYIFGSNDPTGVDTVPGNGDDPNEYGSLIYDSGADEFSIGSGGKIQIATTGPELFLGNATNTADVRIQGGATHEASLGWYKQTTLFGKFTMDGDTDQFQLILDDDGGNLLSIGNLTSDSKDCGHAAQANPTVYFQSDLDCSGAGANLWGSIAHTQSAFTFGTGQGHFDFQSQAATDKGIQLPAEQAAVPDAACNAGGEGVIMYIDDTDDALTGGMCGCVETDDGGTYAWVAMTAGAPCP